MKRHLISFFVIVLIGTLGFLQADTFETFNKVVKDAVPDGFTVNKGQTWNNRFTYKITYDKDPEGMNRLIFSLNPGKHEFSEMDLALYHQQLTWQGRNALFNDGTKTGMSGITVILKNKAGVFSIIHRAIGGKAMTRVELEKFLSSIALKELEK